MTTSALCVKRGTENKQKSKRPHVELNWLFFLTSNFYSSVLRRIELRGSSSWPATTTAIVTSFRGEITTAAALNNVKLSGHVRLLSQHLCNYGRTTTLLERQRIYVMHYSKRLCWWSAEQFLKPLWLEIRPTPLVHTAEKQHKFSYYTVPYSCPFVICLCNPTLRKRWWIGVKAPPWITRPFGKKTNIIFELI